MAGKTDWIRLAERGLDKITEFGSKTEDARTILGFARALDVKVEVGEKTRFFRNVRDAAQWASEETGRTLAWYDNEDCYLLDSPHGGNLLTGWRVLPKDFGVSFDERLAVIYLATAAERKAANGKKSVPSFKAVLRRYWRALSRPLRWIFYWGTPKEERL